MDNVTDTGVADESVMYYVFVGAKIIFCICVLAALYVLAWYAFLYLKSFRKANPPKLPEEKKPLVTAYNESYASFESRLQSFDNCNVELLNQYVGNLCEAGFYYTGDGGNDGVACFSCNIRLQKWEDYDNPWVQHARWSKDCSYLLLCKGQQFINRICGIYDLDYVKDDRFYLREQFQNLNISNLNDMLNAEDFNDLDEENIDELDLHDHQE